MRKKEQEKDALTQTASDEEMLKPRTREEENQSVREALRRILPELVRRNLYEKLGFPDPGQADEDIFEKLLYEFQLVQRISGLQQDLQYVRFAEQEKQSEEQERQREKSIFKSTLKLAREGDIDAQKELCKFYQTGFYTQVNESAAFQWILTAAQNGDKDAQQKVGAFFCNGYGTEKNDESGFYWYMCAAEQGSSKAQKCIGDCYSNGIGVLQNLETAFAWYLKAAQNGNRSAKYLVGLCYYEGTGVPQDLTLAFQWMKAAAPEHGSARRFLKRHKKEFLQFGGEGS